ncbi:MAG TPA: hypothetical protein VK158_05490 [Acidobacteriota bacterium]|nr:hypothetical protein [Acidobacteriota bacterium]
MQTYTVDYGVMLMTAEHHLNIAKAEIHDLDVECHTRIEHSDMNSETTRELIAQYAKLKAERIKALAHELDKILIH